MLKKDMKYVDYDGNEREESFYFNLSKAELMEMELSTTGGLEQTIQNIIKTQDGPRIIEMFKSIILKAYGEKSLDGKYFNKKDPVTGRPLYEKFEQTEAYSDLYMELATDADAAAAFINGIVPKQLAEEAAKQQFKVTQNN